MKIKKYIILPLFVLTLFSFLACKNEPVLATIEKEVSLKQFSVSSALVGFAQVGDYIFSANSELLFTKKKNTEGEWTKIKAPENANLIQKIASNGTTLFVAFNEGGVYSYKNEWKKVKNSDDIQAVFGDSKIFGYAINGQKLYEVKEDGAVAVNNVSFSKGEYLSSAAASYYASSGKAGGKSMAKIYSAKDNKPVAALKGLSDVKEICAGPNNSIFILTDKRVYQFDGKNKIEKNIELEKAEPLSVFYFAEKDMLLIACTKKYVEFKLKNQSLKDASQITVGSQDSTTPPSVYPQFNSTIGKFAFGSIFATADKDGKNYSIFASVSAGSLTKNTGLWAYHSFAEKQEWNRE